MTRTFSDGHPKVLPACNFLSQYYFYNIFLQKSCRFSLQTLTKFEAAKTESGVGFLRLTAVWGSRALAGPDFLSMRGAFVSYSRPIRFDGKSVNRGLPVLDQARASQRSNDWALA